jgi:hypothetical protein
MNKEIETEKIKIRVLEDGIIENLFKGGHCIEAQDFFELRRINLQLMNKMPYVVFVEAEDLTSFSRQARELIASKKFAGITLAKALFIKSLGQRIIGNFYMQVNRPHIKTKLFTDREKAIEWLREQLHSERENRK